ncbi:nucleolar DEAD-box protein required for synthesis of 60S ribosomal subunit [Tilletia horrida]|uniref:RNA helicase n=1 Tax=Tilletia horrida TaxID=155126 RepID=A0AAN6G8W5_9BASI|nr:nucleolar DEAD-box protein required for synthesis of 60S ribosomal subunit [Tilletia horrida]KAK0531258.1 nucleolar DEAD-box protein required for synthesis of 60S ribosomal subunit [Tilletia horrida]KAK0557245.1 nucleolar DEAD-box protein required for synthesis of 60S ribosomal subunit [Tilletia horrida]
MKAAVDDFIMTLDSDEEGAQDSDVEAEAAGSKDAQQEPNGSGSGKKGKKAKKTKEKIIGTGQGSSRAAAGAQGGDLLLDASFNFDTIAGENGANAATSLNAIDINSWGPSSSSKPGAHVLDSIIERRRAKLGPLAIKRKGSGDEEDGLEDEDDLDIEDSQALGAADDAALELSGADDDADDDDDDDEELEFGAGARKRALEELQDGDEDDDDDFGGSSDEVGDEEDTGPGSDEDYDESASESDEEDAAVKARKDAYFASPDEVQVNGNGKGKGKGKASGDDADELFSSFTALNLSRPILRALSTLNFSKPTPIQARTLPIALAGKDLVAGAVTGSGKTAAFLIPTLERLAHRAKAGGQNAKTRVVVLTPTRELAIQCHNVGRALAQYTDIRFCLCVGGLSLKAQEAQLKLRPEVVIATPGRLIDHVRNTNSFSLDDIEILIMDEADRMLEEGFEAELSEIVKSCPKGRQTMLFSATMTDDVDELIRLSLRRPVRLFVDSQKATANNLVQEFVRVRGSITPSAGTQTEDGEDGTDGKGSSKPVVAQPVTGEAIRPALLLTLCLRTFTTRTIIFVRSKKLAHQLTIVFGLLGLAAAELHGDLSQEQRMASLEQFRKGERDFLIATDLASRGLDIRGVETVINFDMPASWEMYVHRVGRTARAGRSGRAVTLVGEADRRLLKTALKHSPASNMKQRVLPPDAIASVAAELEKLKPEIEEVLREEKEEKALAIAEMEARKGENRLKFEEEIMSRPKRTWFTSEKEKEAAKTLSKAEHLAKMDALKAKEKRKKERFENMTRRQKRSRLAREEMEAEGLQKSTDAAVRSIKKSLRPTDLSDPDTRPKDLRHQKKASKEKAKAKRKKTKSSVTAAIKGKGTGAFKQDLGERRAGSAGKGSGGVGAGAAKSKAKSAGGGGGAGAGGKGTKGPKGAKSKGKR